MADTRVKRIRKTSLVQSGDLQNELQKCGRQVIVPKQEVAVPMCSPALVVARFYRSALRQARFQIVPERRLLKRLVLFVPAHVVVPPSPLEQSSGWPPTHTARPPEPVARRVAVVPHAESKHHARAWPLDSAGPRAATNGTNQRAGNGTIGRVGRGDAPRSSRAARRGPARDSTTRAHEI